MEQYQKLLIAVDIEHDASDIIAKAMRLKGPQSQVRLITVITPLTDALYANGLGLVPPLIDVVKLEEESRQRAKEKLRELAGDQVAEDDCDVLVGQTVDSVVDDAEDWNADVIVLGSHGKSGLKLLLGSTASGVLHHAKCDTLMVRI
ncbi:Universal stress protein A [BD1-7 clade bacterium]|uniref:Universal stress protein n=1 Tax=BD1-7 clade bacterium TaxID=2029982 RepID=A0A5S9N6G9_9GAMM|nr:Universal stress protein A [BD1-7 clade bacterium]CAA0084886.1 Universal stress protein A [BD1-7 clade bacterium]